MLTERLVLVMLDDFSVYKKIYCSSKWIWGTFTCTCCYCNPSLIKEIYFFDLQSICKKEFLVDFSFEYFHIISFGSNLREHGKVNYGQRGNLCLEQSVYAKEGAKGGASSGSRGDLHPQQLICEDVPEDGEQEEGDKGEDNDPPGALFL